MYSPQVLDHFEHPRNSGELPNAVSVQLENPACGDVLQLFALVENGTITEIRFKAKGCVCAIACASAMTQMVQGATDSDARRISQPQIAAALGGLSRESMHASHLAADALHQLLLKM